MLPIACPQTVGVAPWPADGINAFACDTCLTWWLEETREASCWFCGDKAVRQKSKIMFHWSQKHRRGSHETAPEEFRYGVSPANLWD